MGLFSTNWRTQVTMLLPPMLRSVSVIDFLSSLVDALTFVMAALSPFNDTVRITSLFSGQKMVLQAALNYLLATSGIIVQPGISGVLSVYVWNEVEGIDVFTYNEGEPNIPMYVWNEAEVPDAYDFLVLVPIAFWTAEVDRRVRAYTKIYKLAGKTFNVITY